MMRALHTAMGNALTKPAMMETNTIKPMNQTLEIRRCSEWAEDPIELEIKLRKAELDGWLRDGLPFRQSYDGTNVPKGNYVQRLKSQQSAQMP